MINDFCTMARTTADRLRKQAAMLDCCPSPRTLGPWTVGFATIANDHLVMISDIEDAITAEDRCIYVFELVDDTAIAPLRAAIRSLKALKPKPFSAPKHNESSPDSRYLYVGSSFATEKRRQTLASRLRQHLGLSNTTTTYAMHLDRWAQSLPGAVKITAFQYPKDVSREAILAIEDCLAQECQPLLGRRGSAR